MKKIIIITTVPLSFATLIKGQPKYLSQFFDVKLVTSYSNINEKIAKGEGVVVHSINMTRKITIIKDLKALFQIFSYLLNEKPDIVYTFTPKAGLLGMIAAFFARVPIRIHNIVGMPLMEATGTKLKLLKFIEKMTYFFSTKLLCNSVGLKKFINENLTSVNITVVGKGSINGVDTDFFHNVYTAEEQLIIRTKLNILEDDFVIIFVGRIVKDKGINELVESFKELEKKYNNLKLLFVGDYEENLHPINTENLDFIKKSKNIITVGLQKDIRDYLAISNLFVLPSYREGLPNSLIEAGSFGIPLLATNINGCNEVIIDYKNGILVDKKSVTSLTKGIEVLLTDTKLYNKIKSNVRETMVNRYSQKYFWKELKNEF